VLQNQIHLRITTYKTLKKLITIRTMQNNECETSAGMTYTKKKKEEEM
jgi:hypothetical protein